MLRFEKEKNKDTTEEMNSIRVKVIRRAAVDANVVLIFTGSPHRQVILLVRNSG